MVIKNRSIFDIVDVIEERCKLSQTLIRDKRFDTLSLLPAAQTSDKTSVTEEGMIKIIAELKQEYDYIIIDCPAGIEQGFQSAVAGADRAIVVTTPEQASVRDADRIIGLLEQEEMDRPKLVINRIRNHMMKSGDMLDVDEIVQVLSIDLIGIVIDDDEVIKASNQGEPVVLEPKSKASSACRNIVRSNVGGAVQ